MNNIIEVQSEENFLKEIRMQIQNNSKSTGIHQK